MMIWLLSIAVVATTRQRCMTPNVTLVSPPQYIINSTTPGVNTVPGGFEGGNTVRWAGEYHMFTATFPTFGWSEINLEHWASHDGQSWARRDVLWWSHWNKGLWVIPNSPMPFYDEELRSWTIYYTLFHQPVKGWTANGTLWVANSITGSIDGPYDFPGTRILAPSNASQPWEERLLDSVSTPFKLRNGATKSDQWAIFYGSGPPPHWNNWNVGLATGPTPRGPFSRRPMGNPIPMILPLGFVENPMPLWLEQHGIFAAAFDFLKPQVTSPNDTTFAIAFSCDGLSWPAAHGRSVDVSSMQKNVWVRTIRTPHTPILELDGSYTVFFTGAAATDTLDPTGKWPFYGVGKVSIRFSPLDVPSPSLPTPRPPEIATTQFYRKLHEADADTIPDERKQHDTKVRHRAGRRLQKRDGGGGASGGGRGGEHHSILSRSPGFPAGAATSPFVTERDMDPNGPCRTYTNLATTQFICGIEWDTWLMIDAFVTPADTVIEFGARFGTSSCALAAATNNSGRVVSVDVDRRIHKALLMNRDTQRCNVNVVMGSVSEKPIMIDPAPNNGYSLQSKGAVNPSVAVPHLRLAQVERMLGIKFNAVLIDCEGCIDLILEQPGFLAQLELIMIEEDQPLTADYQKWHGRLRAEGFELRWRLRDTLFRHDDAHRAWSSVLYYTAWVRAGARRPPVPSCEEYAVTKGLHKFHHVPVSHRYERRPRTKRPLGIDCAPEPSG